MHRAGAANGSPEIVAEGGAPNRNAAAPGVTFGLVFHQHPQLTRVPASVQQRVPAEFGYATANFGLAASGPGSLWPLNGQVPVAFPTIEVIARPISPGTRAAFVCSWMVLSQGAARTEKAPPLCRLAYTPGAKKGYVRYSTGNSLARRYLRDALCSRPSQTEST